MNHLRTWLAAVLMTLPTVALADELPKQVKDLECLVGNWALSGTVTMGDQKADVRGNWNCKRTPGQFGVQCALRMTGVPGMPVYEETDLFGYEPGTDTYHWFSVTNASETHDHVGSPPKGDRADFVYLGTSEGKPFKETIAMTFGKDSKFVTVRAETFLAGKSTSVFDVRGSK